MGPGMSSDTTFSDELEHWLRDAPEHTLGSLSHLFAEKSFATTILLLMFVPAMPLPTGGITHVFEGIAVVIAAQMVIGRERLWLPRRWQQRELGPLTTQRAIPFMIRWVRRCERFSRPRGAHLLELRWMRRILGLVLMALAIAAALAPPFSGLDTLPALGAVAIALAIILGDVVVLAVGLVVGVGGTLIILAIGAAVVSFVAGLF